MFELIRRHELPALPLCEEFNAAVMARANHCVPMGWKAAMFAPYDLPTLNSAVNSNVAMPVSHFLSNPGHSIFGDDGDHELAFKAWSQAVRYKYQIKYTLAGSAQVAYAMIWELFEDYGNDYTVLKWVTMLLCETVGQGYFKTVRGEDYPDGKSFFTKNGSGYKPLANRLAIMHAQGVTQAQFIKEAKATWG